VEGIAALVEDGVWVSIRTTVQKMNYLEMPELVRLARRLGVRQISFLPVDVHSRLAFRRSESSSTDGLALDASDLPAFASVLDELELELELEREQGQGQGLVAESPEKLREMHRYFAALLGLGEIPPPRCNAPRFSAVVRPDGSLQPCHFIEGLRSPGKALAESLNSRELTSIRRAIRKGMREECLRCVCPMRRAPLELLRTPVFGG
jgi:MoaA/NifB/PqqE/SkfB family radical SAM enzyme